MTDFANYPLATALLVASLVLLVAAAVFAVVLFVRRKAVRLKVVAIVLAVVFAIAAVFCFNWRDQILQRRMIEQILAIQEGTFD